MDNYENPFTAPRFNPAGGNPIPDSPEGETVALLRDKQQVDTLAVANEQGNRLAEEEFTRDMDELSYGELYFKYGREIANNRAKFTAAQRNLQSHRADKNTLNTDTYDAATNAATALYNGVGSLAVQGFGYIEGALDPETDGATRAGEYAAAHNAVVGGMSEQNLSQIAQERSYYEGIASQLDQLDNQAEFEEEIEAGASPFWAKARREGKNALDAASRVGNNPMLAVDITAQGVGSLYASAPLAGAGGAVAKGLAGAALRSQVAKKVALAAGTSAGGATLEVSGTFSEGVSAIMDMSQEELNKSPVYQALIEEGNSPNEARIQLAGVVGETAAVRALPSALALGFITNKFERMPVGNFMEGGLTRGLLQITGEGIEEAGQGASQAIAQNTAISSETGLETDAFEGVGEQGTLGAIGGIGAAGVAATPGAARGTVRAGVNKVADQFKDREFNDPLRNAVHGGSNASRAAEAAANLLGDALDVADPAIQKTKKIAGPVVEKIKEKAAPISDKVDEVYNRSSNAAKVEQNTQLRRLENASQEEAKEPDGLSGTIIDRDDNRIPSTLKDVSSNEQTPIQNTVGSIKKIISKGYKPTDNEILYVTNQLSRLQKDMPNLPKKTRKEVSRLLANKDIQSLIAKGVSVDLNTVYDDNTVIDDEVVTTTINTASVAPTNVNPIVARKILNMSNKNYTPEEAKQIEIAAKLSEALNLRSDNYHADKKGTDKVSREIQERGITSTKGKKLRSLNQYATDILTAINNDGVFVSEEGRKIPVATLAKNLGNLVQHMNNKLGAVNESIQKADGNSVQFRTLKDGRDWVEPGQAGASSITIHVGSENSMRLADNIKADTEAANTVYNTLKEAYPEHFKGEEIQSVTIDAEPVAETDTQADKLLNEAKGKEDTQVTTLKEFYDLDTNEDADTFGDPANKDRIQEFDDYVLDGSKKEVVSLARKALEAGVSEEYVEGTIFDTFGNNPDRDQNHFETVEDFWNAVKGTTETDPNQGDLFSETPTAVEEDSDAPATGSTETKGEEKVQLTGKTQYVTKDQAKSDKATKFIGKGSRKSSTEQYRKDWGDKANTGEYTSDDVVFISSEGNRNGRIKPDFTEIGKAVEAGATIITDTAADRSRPYNIGERDVANFLLENGYQETSDGTWEKSEVQETIEHIQEEMDAEMTEEDRELKDVLDDIEKWPEEDQKRIKELSKVAKKKVRAVLAEIMGKDIAKLVQQIQIFPDSVAPNQQGFAFSDGSIIYLNEQLFDEEGNLTPFGETVAVHEAGHITDYTNVDDVVGPVYVSAQNTFYNKGKVFQEMRKLWKMGGRVRDRIDYAISYLAQENPSQTAAEFFAVATEFYFGPDRDTIFAQAPETLALMEKHYGKRTDSARSLQRLEETTSEQDSTGDNEEGEGSETSGEGRVTSDFSARKGKLFKDIFRDVDESEASPIGSLRDFLDMFSEDGSINPYFLEQVQGLVPALVEELNKRLQNLGNIKVKDENGNTVEKTVQQALADGDLDTFPLYKPLMLVDPATMTYDQNLIELAALAALDWLSAATGQDPRKRDQTLDRLGLTENEINEDNEHLLSGMDPELESQRLSNMIKKVWGIKNAPNISLQDHLGITAGLAKEIFTVMSEGFTEEVNGEIEDGNFLEMHTVKQPKVDENGNPVYTSKKDKEGNPIQATTSLSVLTIKDPTFDFQDGIAEAKTKDTPDSMSEAVFNTNVKQGPSFGENTHTVDTEQEYSGIPLSEKEISAIENIQNQAHHRSDNRAKIVNLFGDTLFKLMGGREDEDSIKNESLRRSVEGKNLSIRMNISETKDILKQATDETIGVFYKARMYATGRIGLVGPNYQNNKLLRGTVTNTWAEYDLNKKSHMNLYWLAVAQGLGLKVNGQKVKLEKVNHRKVQKGIQKAFNEEYGELKDMLKEAIKNGNFNPEAFFEKSGVMEPAEIYSILAVAELEIAKETRGQNTIRSPLSAEIDGLTNGAANMMANFGIGELTLEEYENLQRIGYFVGSQHKSVNDIFTKGWKDLYETTSEKSEGEMVKRIAEENNPERKERFAAIQRFAVHFGNFEYDANEENIRMTRDTSKNPMTKVNYGAAAFAVGKGIADAMITEFYRKMEGSTFAELQEMYPDIKKDMELLFDMSAEGIVEESEFTPYHISKFQQATFRTIGEILTDTTKSVIGDKITHVNDMMVFSTNIQNRYIQLKFEQMLDERAERYAATQDHLGDKNPLRNPNGKPKKNLLPKKDYDNIIKELSLLAPILSSEDQTLSLGSLENVRTDFKLSRNLTGGMQTTTLLKGPSDIGVRVIPYGVIGTGDALMMLEIFSPPEAPKDAMDIFDGFDVPALKLLEYAQLANAAVLRTWDRDVMGMGVANFQSFLNRLEKDDALLEKAFKEVSEMKQQADIAAEYPTIDLLLAGLNENHRLNKARKAVFKRTPTHVDQMGGSGKGFQRGKGTKGLSNINREIREELNANTKKPEYTAYDDLEEVVVGDLATTIRVYSSKLRGDARKVLEVLKDSLDPDMKVVIGSLDQLNEYRQNLLTEDDGQVIDAAAVYDGANNIIFLNSRDPEALLHEMVHAATFESIYDHYNGGKPQKAVERLEALMEEFLKLPMPNNTVRKTKSEIQLHLQDQSANGKASALNEFMAYVLVNGETKQFAKNTRTITIANMSKKVLNLLRSIMGFVPRDMWSNVFANTALLRNVTPHDPLPNDDGESLGDQDDVDVSDSDDGGDISDGGDPPSGNDGSNQLTPPFDNFHNFWIELLKKRIEQARAGNLKLDKRIRDYSNVGVEVLDKLIEAGFAFSDREARVFKAIHAVMSIEIQLDPRSLLAMQRSFEHVQANLSPSDFGEGTLANERYEAVMDALGGTTSNNASDAVPVLLALSQTNATFRAALENLEAPTDVSGRSNGINEHMTTVSVILMKSLLGHVAEGKAPKNVLDDLAKTIIRNDEEREYTILRHITGTLRKGDKYVSGKLKALARNQSERNERVSNSNRSGTVKFLSDAITLHTNFLDSDRAAKIGDASKELTHMGIPLDGMFIPLRELVTEMVGTDATNKPFMALLDRTNDAVSAVRQTFREHLPVVLQSKFNTAPVAEQWKLMFHAFAKTDFAAVFGGERIQAIMEIFGDTAVREQRIEDAEANLATYFSGNKLQELKDEAKQLANYMNGGGPGKFLIKNPYAMVRRKTPDTRSVNEDAVKALDELVTLYAINNMNPDSRGEVYSLYQEETDGVRSLVIYLNHLKKNEDAKPKTDTARMNYVKGYIPNLGKQNTHIIIAPDADKLSLKEKGYKKLGPWEGDPTSAVPQSYYVSNVRQQGQYNQGIMQNVQQTYYGVDSEKGYSVTGETSGSVTGEDSEVLIEEMNDPDYEVSDTEGLIPYLNTKGEIIFFEKSISREVMDTHSQREENLALMIGAWAGRQAEEKFASQFNYELVNKLKDVWDNREAGTENMFIDLSDEDLKDPVYRESYLLIPQNIKDYIDSTFGGAFMVRKDMINLSVGYRIPSVVDLWSGKTRMPKTVQQASVIMVRAILGDKGYRYLSKGEETTQGVVSSAKDIIVIRSLIVPAMNAQANVLQLANRGVPIKQITKGTRDKLAEIEEYHKNIRKVTELKHELILARNNPNLKARIQRKIEAIEALHERMSIAPMIKAGQYKNLSEGLTEMDTAINAGKILDLLEQKAKKLPKGLKTAADIGMVSKSTKIYQIANRAVQYGDFIAKSIYYDHLINEGLSHEDALSAINQEFVNFSVPPGRSRDYSESIGVSWFMAFKLRITKIAMNMMRENPVSTIAAQGLLGVEDSPFDDNVLSVFNDDRLGYALGWDMLFGSPALIPWVQITDG